MDSASVLARICHFAEVSAAILLEDPISSISKVTFIKQRHYALKWNGKNLITSTMIEDDEEESVWIAED